MWKKVKLKDVCKIVNGGTPKSNVKEYWEGEIQWLTPKDMGKLNSKYVDATERQITVEGLENSSAKLVPENSLILSCRAPIGHVFVNSIEMSFNQGCKALIPSAVIDINYLYYFVYSSKQLLNDLGTGTTFKEISSKTLGNVEISLPPIAEQQRIVAKLDATFAEIDKSIKLVEDKLTEAQNLRDSSIIKIFDENLISAEKYILDKVVSRLTNGYVGATKNIYQDDGIPYLLARHVKNNTLTFDGKTFVTNQFNEKNKKSILKQDDVLLVQSGHIGHTAVVPKEHEGHNCHAMIVMTTVKEILTGEYLSALLNSRTYKVKLLNLRTGSTVPHLNCGDVKKLKIPVPKKETQDKVVCLTKSVTESFKEIESLLAKKINLLTMLRTSILTQELQPQKSEAA